MTERQILACQILPMLNYLCNLYITQKKYIFTHTEKIKRFCIDKDTEIDGLNVYTCVKRLKTYSQGFTALTHSYPTQMSASGTDPLCLSCHIIPMILALPAYEHVR